MNELCQVIRFLKYFLPTDENKKSIVFRLILILIALSRHVPVNVFSFGKIGLPKFKKTYRNVSVKSGKTSEHFFVFKKIYRNVSVKSGKTSEHFFCFVCSFSARCLLLLFFSLHFHSRT